MKDHLHGNGEQRKLVNEDNLAIVSAIQAMVCLEDGAQCGGTS
jgi:hypothetical protein